MKRQTGFTFIEIMIAVIIIGIIAMITIPTYNSYIQKQRRLEAISTLESISLLQEKYRLNHDHYATLNDIWGDTASLRQYYSITISDINPQGFVLTANAIGDQKDDKQNTISCSQLKVTIKNQTIKRNPSICWVGR
ncbi:type IV pilin protein [Thiotrichales bacterium 19S9-12]|nr:type IV pilin protein [Thiotrichales bacterium 19S9-11]MCF6812429.1 type IV pilin protein [Thiotrichales bacterium 19S9-12]